MEKCRKPIIGAIAGFAVTAGFEIALACDLLIAAKGAKFMDTHARLGQLSGIYSKSISFQKERSLCNKMASYRNFPNEEDPRSLINENSSGQPADRTRNLFEDDVLETSSRGQDFLLKTGNYVGNEEINGTRTLQGGQNNNFGFGGRMSNAESSVQKGQVLLQIMFTNATYYDRDATDYDGAATDYDGAATDYDRDATDYDCDATDYDRNVTDYDLDITDNDRDATDNDRDTTDNDRDTTDYDRDTTDYDRDATNYKYHVIQMSKIHFPESNYYIK
ncbi:hypothetical protein QQ045_028662 [Rhodiola kirilowii]